MNILLFNLALVWSNWNGGSIPTMLYGPHAEYGKPCPFSNCIFHVWRDQNGPKVPYYDLRECEKHMHAVMRALTKEAEGTP